MTVFCSACNQQAPPDAAFCDNCGSPLSSAASVPAAGPAGAGTGQNSCPSCGASIIAGTAFCDNCGAALEQAAPGAPYQPPASPPPAGAPQPPTPSWPAAGGHETCPSCHNQIIPGSAFCDHCGVPLSPGQPGTVPPGQPGTIPPEQSGSHIQPPPPQPGGYPTISSRFVVQPTGASIPVPSGKNEIVIGREDPVSNVFPDIDLGRYGGDEGGVSRRHARLTIQGAQCFLEDLKTVNHTYVNKQQLQPGVKQPLNNGDELRFGRIIVNFYVQ